MSMGSVLGEVAQLKNTPTILVNASAACLALVWTAVILRVYVRAWMIHSFGWDDGTIVLSSVLLTGACAILIVFARIEMSDGLRDAAGKGILAELEFLKKLIKAILAFIPLYLCVGLTVRVSLAIFFLRVTVVPWHRMVIYVTTIIYSLYAIAFVFVVIFECGNPKNFLAGQEAGTCLPNRVTLPLYYVAAAMNAISDWIFVFFPLYLLLKSRMLRPAKISAGILLAIAAAGSVAAIVRIPYIPDIKGGPHFISRAMLLGVWAIVEPTVYIVTVSLATLRPLASDCLHRIGSNGYYGEYGYYGSKSRSGSSRVKGRPSAPYSLGKGHARLQVHDPESDLSSDIESHSMKHLTVIQESDYDVAEVASVEDGTQGSHSRQPPRLPPPVHQSGKSR